MSSVLGRVKNRIDMTKKKWDSDCKFSKRLAVLRVLDEVGGRVHCKRISQWAHEKKDRWIITYLENKLQPVIEKYKYDEFAVEESLNAPIWVCWWTGAETAPQLVKICIQSIYRYSEGHPVHIITKDNWAEYLTIPPNIISLVEDGSVCLANFSDYLRVSLLREYGGIWLDATIFLNQRIDERFFHYPFFTCKQDEIDCGYISKKRWTSFCLGGYQNNPFFRYMQDGFLMCWSEDKVSVDYLLVDYLIEVAYRNFSWFREMLDELPNNNEHRDDLQAAFNRTEPAEKYAEIVQPLNKLSWREVYSQKTAGGEESCYGWFLRQE